MKIQLLSDTHWEHLGDKFDIPDIEPTDADVIVLAGDIHSGYYGIIWAAKQMERLNKPVIYVAGNHEYYSFDIDDLNRDLKKVAKAYGIHYLENNSVVIEGVRFLGTTLWTNYGKGHPGLMEAAQMRINDYRYIFAKQWWSTKAGKKAGEKWLHDQCLLPKRCRERFIPHTAYHKHKQAIRWLKKTLDQPHDGKTVIVTHHAPLYDSIQSLVNTHFALNEENWYPDRYDRLDLFRVAGYASDLSELIQKYHNDINLWIHGHTHRVQDYAVKGVRVTANPRGYPYGDKIFKQDEIQMFGGETKLPAPTDGNLEHFNPNGIIDLDDGVWPAIWPKCETTATQWDAIYQEAIDLKPYAHNKDLIMADLASRRMAELANEFNQVTRQILLPVLSNLNPKKSYSPDDKVIEPSQIDLAQHIPNKTVYVNDGYSPAMSKVKSATHSPKSFYDDSLKGMKSVRKHLMTWILGSLKAHGKTKKS